MRHVLARSSCIHAMDASNTSRIFNPKPDVAACISKQSSIVSLSLASSLPPCVSLPSVPPLSFPFSFFSFLPLFLFPPFVTARHWTWLGLVSFVNGIFSLVLHIGKGSSQAKWNSRLCSFCGENGGRGGGGRMNEFDGSIGKFELGDFNLTLETLDLFVFLWKEVESDFVNN